MAVSFHLIPILSILSVLTLKTRELNNTWVYDYEPYCDVTVIWNDLICQVRRGNYYYENESSTFTKFENLVAAGGALQEETNASGEEAGIPILLLESLDGTDTFDFGPIKLNEFPIGIPRLEWDHGYTMLHALGLGRNSTLLNSLVETGQIASRVWSLFWGRMWIDNWLDGSLVLGGYNSDLTLQQNYTQALDYSDGTGCWTGMKVTVIDIILNFRDGTDTSIFPSNYALPCCIVPQRQLLIEAPVAILESFENKTGMASQGVSYGLHWAATQFLAENA